MGYICIHGHFYQPPRENPWLEAIELQESAHPYHDWNERVTAECYVRNAASRILDDEKRITKIVNNYAKISFNFGPTLLSWIEDNNKGLYQAILEADAESRERYAGHGSAIAQPYNHIIMPLANERDKYTQAVWGKHEFEFRFGRPPEGMWLPETAVDLRTLEILAELGIKFTILAPNQARRTRKIDAKEWNDVSQGRIDPTMAYLVELPSGRSINVFFYDGPISRGIAFEGLLDNGEQFGQRLLGAFSKETRPWPELVHIATDGETYGHHHRFGEMALTYALNYIESNKLAELTNYGQYLERHPPTHVAEIFENTSWSCAHGIERWRSNCGCNSGGHPGWNQEWRAPLRQALDWLRDTVAPHFEKKARELLKDPWGARNDYIELVLDRCADNLGRFLAKHGTRKLGEAEKVTALKLLELQRHAMLMYTSCGWFFDELSGIETVQVIKYAGRVVQLAQEILGDEVEARFVEMLGKAKSNIAEHKDGAHIYEEFVKPAFVNLKKLAVHYAIRSLFEPYETEARIYCYKVRREAGLNLTRGEAGERKLAVGRAQFTSVVTEESDALTFVAFDAGDYNPMGAVQKPDGDKAYQSLLRELEKTFSHEDLPQLRRLVQKNFDTEIYTLTALFKDEQRRILSRLVESQWAEAETALENLYPHVMPIMRTVVKLGVALNVPRAFYSVAEFALNTQLRRGFSCEEMNSDAVKNLLADAQTTRIALDVPTLEYTLRMNLERLAKRFATNHGNMELLKRLDTATALARSLPFEVSLWKTQNIWFDLLQAVYPEYQKKAEAGDQEAKEWIGHYKALAERLSLRVA
jgi:alpha-amylase/alpha-mannosidase (GH57 family)